VLTCARCDEPIDDGTEAAIPHIREYEIEILHYHPECRLRMMIGGLNHLLGRCTCCGGTEPPDPPEMSRRQAALAAVAAWRAQDNNKRLANQRICG
jgi:hypothetical protein